VVQVIVVEVLRVCVDVVLVELVAVAVLVVLVVAVKVAVVEVDLVMEVVVIVEVVVLTSSPAPKTPPTSAITVLTSPPRKAMGAPRPIFLTSALKPGLVSYPAEAAVTIPRATRRTTQTTQQVDFDAPGWPDADGLMRGAALPALAASLASAAGRAESMRGRDSSWTD